MVYPRRNDIDIAVTKDGVKLVAQGTARRILAERTDISDRESGLCYASLSHRTVWRNENKKWVIRRPKTLGPRQRVQFGTFRLIGLSAQKGVQEVPRP